MYDFKTDEYRLYVEAHNAMVEREKSGEVITVQDQLTVQIAFTTAQVAATEVLMITIPLEEFKAKLGLPTETQIRYIEIDDYREPALVEIHVF